MAIQAPSCLLLVIWLLLPSLLVLPSSESSTNTLPSSLRFFLFTSFTLLSIFFTLLSPFPYFFPSEFSPLLPLLLSPSSSLSPLSLLTSTTSSFSSCVCNFIGVTVTIPNKVPFPPEVAALSAAFIPVNGIVILLLRVEVGV